MGKSLVLHFPDEFLGVAAQGDLMLDVRMGDAARMDGFKLTFEVKPDLGRLMLRRRADPLDRAFGRGEDDAGALGLVFRLGNGSGRRRLPPESRR